MAVLVPGDGTDPSARPGILIRTASAKDVSALAGLIESVQQLHVAARSDFFKPAARADLETWAGQALASSSTRVVVAEVGGVVVGYAVVLDGHRPDNVFAHERHWREVEQLAVHPDHRRRGVARALIDHIVATAIADGIPALELSTWTFNKEAQAAFEGLGFTAKSLRFERLSVEGDPSPVKALPSGAGVEARLREASRLAGSLRPEDRLATKVDLSAAGITARLKEASDLLDTCRALARAGADWERAAGGGSDRKRSPR